MDGILPLRLRLGWRSDLAVLARLRCIASGDAAPAPTGDRLYRGLVGRPRGSCFSSATASRQYYSSSPISVRSLAVGPALRGLELLQSTVLGGSNCLLNHTGDLVIVAP